MSPILIVVIALAGLWVTASILAVCLCRIASRGDSLRAEPIAARATAPHPFNRAYTCRARRDAKARRWLSVEPSMVAVTRWMRSSWIAMSRLEFRCR